MSRNGRTFDSIRTVTGKRSKGCPRCGAEKNAGSVNVQLQELTSQGQLSRRVTSRAKSLCEPCSIEVYEALVTLLLQEGWCCGVGRNASEEIVVGGRAA